LEHGADSLAHLFGQLVQRGEAMQHGVEETLREMLGQFRLHDRAPDPEQPFDGTFEWLTDRMRLATRRDLCLLEQQLRELDAAVEALGREHVN
jgi:hypothetical protein